ncbi:MAG: hypothetical protein CM1200mP15_20900 [Dehalococcoidia bacterium]|nr:MAG: hypothetical protein CM1200mP15_20900 [Dehalococcoidia bacterium]
MGVYGFHWAITAAQYYRVSRKSDSYFLIKLLRVNDIGGVSNGVNIVGSGKFTYEMHTDWANFRKDGLSLQQLYMVTQKTMFIVLIGS